MDTFFGVSYLYRTVRLVQHLSFQGGFGWRTWVEVGDVGKTVATERYFVYSWFILSLSVYVHICIEKIQIIVNNTPPYINCYKVTGSVNLFSTSNDDGCMR